ncbi:MAG: hypothetical protein ABI432_05965 [Flavobacteriales bacterium]
MSRTAILLLAVLTFIACGSSSGGGSMNMDGSPMADAEGADEQRPATKFIEGKDYMVLERLRVIDPSGFAQPMEAYSILVPKGWKSTGGITWKVGNTCMAEVINNRLTVTSPDGHYALELYPQQQWDWWDDQMMLQTQMQQAQNPVFRRCAIAQPMDAGQFMQGPLAQEMGARVTNVEPSEELNNALRQQAQAANQQFQQAGVSIESRPSAVIGTLSYPDGSAGVALCSIAMQVSWMPNYMTGGQSASYSCQATQKIALKCPVGKEAEARKLLSTVMSSLRINPEWQAGVQQMVSNVAAMEQRETMKRAAIQRDAANYSADLQQRTWEEGAASRDRIAESWGQTLRGVETWRDASGSSVELSSGYNEAWSRPDGSYILSNNPLFDPNVAFQEDWKKLEKGR